MAKTSVKKISAARKPKTNGHINNGEIKNTAIAATNGALAGTRLDIAAGRDFAAGATMMKSSSGIDLTEKIKELLRLAQEQGYLTYNDINEALPDGVVADDLDEIYSKLRNLEVEIVDQAEVDRVKQPEPEEEEDKVRLDILDDPVRMYLKQMGQVPLLTREQEVEISKRIEDAENEVKRIIYSFGFAGKEHIALAEKLISEPPKERFDRVIVDKKIEGRENHLKELRKLVKDRSRPRRNRRRKIQRSARNQQDRRGRSRSKEFRKADEKLQKSFPKFYYKQKVIEEMGLVAENIHDKIQVSLRTIAELEAQRKSPAQQNIIQAKSAKFRRSKFSSACSTRITSSPISSCSISAARLSRRKQKWSKPICASSFPSPKNTPTAACRSWT